MARFDFYEYQSVRRFVVDVQSDFLEAAEAGVVQALYKLKTQQLKIKN
jgi:hypothetical protein